MNLNLGASQDFMVIQYLINEMKLGSFFAEFIIMMILRGLLGEISMLFLWSHETSYTSTYDSTHIEAFRNVMDHCALSDMGFQGSQYTWCNNHSVGDQLRKRLDHFVCNEPFYSLFPAARVSHLQWSKSDHCTIALNITASITGRDRRSLKSFCYEECWSKNPDCEKILSDNGMNAAFSFSESIRASSLALRNWGKSNIRYLFKQINSQNAALTVPIINPFL